MAPTNPDTKHIKPEKTNVGEQVLDLVIPYFHDVEGRSSLSLVSRKFYELDGITRKRLTVHVLYYPNPTSLSKRFPFIESLTLKGPPSVFKGCTFHHDTRVTPWIEQIALEFRCLKEVNIRCMVVNDEDLKTLARTRGKNLRSLKIKKCKGFSTDGLMHISMYCNQLRTLCLGHAHRIYVKDGSWLHQLALNSTVLEMFKFKSMDMCDTQDLTLLVKNCSNSLISLKMGACYLSKLRDAFRYAFRLERFGGIIWDDESDLVGFQFPLNTRSLSVMHFYVIQYSSVVPLLNHIRKLKFVDMDEDSQCLLYKNCPNLEVLYTVDVGEMGLQVLGQFCKKLRKLTNLNLVSDVGMIDLAKGCTNMECLNIKMGDISNEALECLGTHLKNLCKFRVNVVKIDGTIDLPLDIGILAMLMGCRNLERLDMNLWHGGLTDVGLEYIGKYGANLRSLSLTLIGISNAGLVKLSHGCPRLTKLELKDCPFREQAVVSVVFNIPSLRYVSIKACDRTRLALTRPEFQL